MEPTFLDRLIRKYNDNEVVIDPPPSYVFNEKLPFSLPFSPEFRDYFDDHVRRTLVPTVLVSAENPDLSALVPFVRHEDSGLLNDLESWTDIYKLPESLRARLVMKCGSAHQWDNHGGHGVFRLGGSPEAAHGVLDPILDRVTRTGEPWVVQPYLGLKWRVPVAHLSRPHESTELNMHAKLGVYFHLSSAGEHRPVFMGGIATLGTDWKVSGASSKPARIDEAGRLRGAFRHDIRVGVSQ
jgi:hypothetical protein